MSLFRFDDIKKKETIPFEVSNDLKFSSSIPEIKSIIDAIGTNDLISFYTDGKWSAYQLVIALFTHFGSGSLSFCTWGLSEPPLRAIQALKDKELITSIIGIVDYRIKERQPKAFQYFESIADNFGFAKSHAKGYFIEINNYKFSILTSANFCRNNKNEFGIIIKSTTTFDFYNEWIQQHLPQIKKTK